MKKLLAVLLAIMSLVGLTFVFDALPVDAGVVYAQPPSNPVSVTWKPDQWQSPTPVAQHVWFPIEVGPNTNNNSVCRLEMRYGNFNNRAYANLRYVSGQCDRPGGGAKGFGGINITMLRAVCDCLQTIPLPAVTFCAAGSQTITGCVQLADGSIWLQPVDTFNTYIVQSSAVVCQAYFSGIERHQCQRKTLSI